MARRDPNPKSQKETNSGSREELREELPRESQPTPEGALPPDMGAEAGSEQSTEPADNETEKRKGLRATVGRRRRFTRALTELHYELRTEGGSATQQGFSIALGTFLGCLPVYGLHLPLCVGFAKLFRLSRVKTYLAAHVNNPLTFPFLTAVEIGVGHYVKTGMWPALNLDELRQIGFLQLLRDALLGSLVVGTLLAAVLGLLAFVIGLRWKEPRGPLVKLREEATRGYIEAGILDWEFARGKLKWDPVFFEILQRGLLPTSGRLLDLGCGRGLLFALIQASHRVDELPPDWPPVPELKLHGVDMNVRHLEAARLGLGPEVRLEVADAASYIPKPADGIVLFDVLHYLDGAGQRAVLAACATALTPGGRLLIREANANGGFSFWLTKLAERLSAIVRRDKNRKFLFRATQDWTTLLRDHGLEVESAPMSQGTPYANDLIVAIKPAATPINPS